MDSNIDLRLLELSDASDFFELMDSQREYFEQWLPFVQYIQNLNDSIAFVQSIVETSPEQNEFAFTIRKDDQLIGLIGIKPIDTVNKKTEIGYWLSQKEQNQGIMTQSVEKICNFAFEQLALHRITIKCAVDNERSKRIPQRLGFTFEGVERQSELVSGTTYRDLEVYSKLYTD